MTDNEIIKAVYDSVEYLRRSYAVPNPATRYKPGGSTGNLAFNALQVVIRNGAIEVYVNKNIAPYMPYTNEPWVAAFWNGKKNPNEGWWQRFSELLIAMVAQRLKGVLK